MERKIITIEEIIANELTGENKWFLLAREYILTEDIMREYADKLNWSDISFYQTLSEPFMEEFKDRLNWDSITLTQKLSSEFIKKYRSKLNKLGISQNVKIPYIVRKNVIDLIKNKKPIYHGLSYFKQPNKLKKKRRQKHNAK
jgi:hypothetical protein